MRYKGFVNARLQFNYKDYKVQFNSIQFYSFFFISHMIQKGIYNDKNDFLC